MTPINDNAREHQKTAEEQANSSAGKWYVYILRCADGSYYTGITNDLSRRCQQHNAGTASRYTRSRLPVCLEYQETLTSRSLALKRELAIKALPRNEKQSLIANRREQ